MKRDLTSVPALLAIGVVLLAALPLSAQIPFSQLGEGAEEQNTDSTPAVFDGLNAIGLGGPSSEIHVTATCSIDPSARTGQLAVTAELSPEWHISSVTQPPGGTLRTEIHVDPSDQFEQVGPFVSDQPPQQRTVKYFDVALEEHYERVTWSAPIRLLDDTSPHQLNVSGWIDGQVCQGEIQCIPLTREMTAFNATPVRVARASTTAVSAAAASSSTAPPFRAPDARVQFRGHIQPATVAPGSTAQFVLTAASDDKWHIYLYEDVDPNEIAKPTLIVITEGSVAGRAETAAEVHESPPILPGYPPIKYHDGEVTWTATIPIPSDARPGQYRVAGELGYQTCTNSTCDVPRGASFVADLTVAGESAGGSAPLQFVATTYETASAAASQRKATGNWPPVVAATGQAVADRTVQSEPAPTEQALSLPAILGLCLLGGLLLNLMPCVLPVIGLKVLSFVEQGGQSRARVLSLNLWYVAGMISVFMVLATLAVFLNIGLGEMFTYVWFKVALTALVFTMGLSFLGVWEIPIPGFAGTGKANELSAKEGPAGAFFKGVFTTILATPCSGPGLGVVFGLTLSQPATVTYLVFSSIGLGMALPYILIGIEPGLVKFLPRPGAWMETFKQLMGFLLLLTVIYLFYTLGERYFLATLTLLVGLGFGCWWVGRTPITAGPQQKSIAWIGGLATAALLGLFGFRLLVAPTAEQGGIGQAAVKQTAYLEWHTFSPNALSSATASGKTVMVDFTANWCPTCKWNLKTAIDTKNVSQAVTDLGIVPMLADWTDRNDEIKQTLATLQSRSIPVLAIYPAGRLDQPIILRDIVTESQVLSALEQAGPSVVSGDSGTTARLDPTGANVGS
jgi:thiol:disulfide interchange protein